MSDNEHSAKLKSIIAEIKSIRDKLPQDDTRRLLTAACFRIDVAIND